MASQATRPIRIIALPLTRATPIPSGSATIRPQLTYYHFQITTPPSTSKEYSQARKWAPAGGWVRWASGKAANIWDGFGKAREGSWKLKVYRTGERLVDRIEFEELALKGIDPSFGPSIRHPDFGGHSRDDIKSKPTLKIPLLYPPSMRSPDATLSYLLSMVQHRVPKHRKGFYTWMLLAPFTAPFMLIPIIPNLPFFYCAWRSWHHYRAYRASQYVQALIENGHMHPEPSPVLDKLYENSKSSTTTEKVDSSESPLLLTRDVVPRLLEELTLKQDEGSDIYRALEQASNR
ncbi:hypothetical protein ONZ45_g11947 [Pleurotus djamor]|nr:hypothetical protein ONZ45_g11947 [Pleurotus djamor]